MVVSCEINEHQGKCLIRKKDACYGYCDLKELGRVDLRNERNGFFKPIDMAVNPEEPTSYANFVILSQSSAHTSLHRDVTTNTLHHVRVSHDSVARIEPHVREYFENHII